MREKIFFNTRAPQRIPVEQTFSAKKSENNQKEAFLQEAFSSGNSLF
jgi:hypothetical protein